MKLCFTVVGQAQWGTGTYLWQWVCTHGNFIVLPHWNTCYPTQSYYPDTELTSACPILIMPSARLRIFLWVEWETWNPPPNVQHIDGLGMAWCMYKLICYRHYPYMLPYFLTSSWKLDTLWFFYECSGRTWNFPQNVQHIDGPRQNLMNLAQFLAGNSWV